MVSLELSGAIVAPVRVTQRLVSGGSLCALSLLISTLLARWPRVLGVLEHPLGVWRMLHLQRQGAALRRCRTLPCPDRLGLVDHYGPRSAASVRSSSVVIVTNACSAIGCPVPSWSVRSSSSSSAIAGRSVLSES